MSRPDRTPAPEAARRLVVYVPGLWGSADSWRELRQRLAAEPDLQNVRFETWDPRVQPWSRERLDHLAHRLQVQIDTWWTVAEERAGHVPFDEIILIGHSLGGLVARQAYMLGRGWYARPLAARPRAVRPWAGAVTRIVLLAAPNRGFRPQRLPWYARALLAGASRLTTLMAEDVQAGSPYITDLRLRWMQEFNRAQNEEPKSELPWVVQLLGDRDSLVAREDSLDVEQFENAAQLALPGTHADLPRLDVPDADDRYLILRRAIFGEVPSTCPPEILADQTKGTTVLAVHGIRTGKESWEALLKQLRRADPSLVAVAPSYGYFSAMSFALPLTRRRNLRFLLDLYSHEFARRRDNEFHFVGHSNGTYLLGRALAQVPAIKFHRVYLAGTVLSRDYPWLDRFADEQVESVRVDQARRDVPVGWLCAALRGLGRRDIGTAGVDGFDQDLDGLHQHHYLRGGHASALEPDRLPGIVAYLLAKDNRAPACLAGRSYPFGFVSRLAPYLAFVGVVAGGAAAAKWIATDHTAERLATVGGALGAAWIVGHTV